MNTCIYIYISTYFCIYLRSFGGNEQTQHFLELLGPEVVGRLPAKEAAWSSTEQKWLPLWWGDGEVCRKLCVPVVWAHSSSPFSCLLRWQSCKVNILWEVTAFAGFSYTMAGMPGRKPPVDACRCRWWHCPWFLAGANGSRKGGQGQSGEGGLQMHRLLLKTRVIVKAMLRKIEGCELQRDAVALKAEARSLIRH